MKPVVKFEKAPSGLYLYETHLHTYPVSRCAKKSVGENMACYQALGYQGIFITNHFLDGNINIDKSLSYEEKLNFYLSDYWEAKSLEHKMGLRVFFGVELSFKGTDFLIYGLPPEWYFDHPEITEMNKKVELAFMMEEGALVIQAHPYREASYIDHIRLYPRSVHGVEVLNACRNELENTMAEQYAVSYDLIPFAGTDNHKGIEQPLFSGIAFDTPLNSEEDFVLRIQNKEGTLFSLSNGEEKTRE